MSPSSIKILIVEDEVLIAMHLARQLAQAGYELCAPVWNGADALVTAGRERPSVVLLDVRLPGDLDGIETGRLIRDRFDIPIVFLTGYSDPDIESRAREITSTELLGKPASVRQIGKAIEQALR